MPLVRESQFSPDRLARTQRREHVRAASPGGRPEEERARRPPGSMPQAPARFFPGLGDREPEATWQVEARCRKSGPAAPDTAAARMLSCSRAEPQNLHSISELLRCVRGSPPDPEGSRHEPAHILIRMVLAQIFQSQGSRTPCGIKGGRGTRRSAATSDVSRPGTQRARRRRLEQTSG